MPRAAEGHVHEARARDLELTPGRGEASLAGRGRALHSRIGMNSEGHAAMAEME